MGPWWEAVQETGLEVEDESQSGRRIRWRKTSRKVEDTSGAEAESKTERHGIRRFPLQ